MLENFILSIFASEVFDFLFRLILNISERVSINIPNYGNCTTIFRIFQTLKEYLILVNYQINGLYKDYKDLKMLMADKNLNSNFLENLNRGFNESDSHSQTSITYLFTLIKIVTNVLFIKKKIY